MKGRIKNAKINANNLLALKKIFGAFETKNA